MSVVPEINKVGAGVKPSTVAVIVAALAAGGYLSPGDRIVGIRRKDKMSPWKKSGLIKQMLGRDLSIDFNSL